MKIRKILSASLLCLATTYTYAQFSGVVAAEAATSTAKLSGTFQSYDPRARVMRISDIEYAVSTVLANRQSNRLQDLRFGKHIIFSVSDFDPQGRSVIVEIDSQ